MRIWSCFKKPNDLFFIFKPSGIMFKPNQTPGVGWRPKPVAVLKNHYIALNAGRRAHNIICMILKTNPRNYLAG
jgi:hypothetical protein